ncbi:MAG: zf-TFIIB domain-containing protein [Myxococcota bacterium]
MSVTCPDCSEPLQPLFIDLPGRADVPLDRCASCGGLWFDFGELEQVTGRAARIEVLADAGTSRRCPRCTLSLTPVFLDGATPVETCTACRGLWFDFVDVSGVASPRLDALAKPGARQREGLAPPDDDGPVRVVGFECAACHLHKPYSEARGTAKGLVCSACSPEVQPAPAGPSFDGLIRNRTWEMLEGFLRVFWDD